MSRKERIDKLKKAIETLKNEYIGLDKILDELETSICPWYVTPEVISRPQIISLWGMTGTGKTSVIHRLIELLDLKPQTLFFDCGESSGDTTKSVSDKIDEYLGEDDDSGNSEVSNKKLVFVFDEFQYARTINEGGDEVDKPNLRAIWNLMDSGIINMTTNGWDTLSYVNFLDDLTGFAEEHPNIKVDSCNVTEEDDVKTVLDDLGLLYFDRGVPGLLRPRRGNYTMKSVSEEEYKEDENPYRPLRIVQDDIIRILRRKLGSRCGMDHFRDVLKSLMEAETINEITSILGAQKPYIVSPKFINCTDSLVFILGNLDEAYRDSADINPDIDADLFFDTTSRVSIHDIKEALKKRFRAEQIARFGNNIIKYPCLGRTEFKQIISKECSRLCGEFYNNFGITVNVEQDFQDLLYSEGVYPVQGVRPVLTTIGTILTPILSKILMFLDDKENKEEYHVSVNLHGETDFKKPDIMAHIDYSSILHESVHIKLQLGAERNPGNRKTSVINSVHEAGHAIVMAYLTGIIPMQIISVSIDHGGFCLTYDKERDSEIESRQDVANKVCIGLAGYEAEVLMYGDRPEMLLCGSSSDITSVWAEFSQVAYKSGYFEPFCYSAILNEQSADGIPEGYKDTGLTDKIKSEFDRLRKLTQDILAGNKDLLKKMAIVLSEKGGMTKNDMAELVKDNLCGTLNQKRLEEAQRLNDYKWYREKL